MDTGTVTARQVRDHYDRLSSLYRAFWGEHIHHGLWSGPEDRRSPAEAQLALIEELAGAAAIPRGARVLDVGSGLGGSALWLARHLDCPVLGLTVSPVQRDLAERAAAKAGLSGRVAFQVQDADHLSVPAAAFDVVWVVECSEHLAAKARFFENAFAALRPGGVLTLCAWLSADHLTPAARELVADVCRGMLCPSLGSRSDHLAWLEAAGFGPVTAVDLTRRVERTWDICGDTVRRLRVDRLLGVIDPRAARFIAAFDGIRRAYRDGAMAYGLFVAGKPPTSA